MPIFFFAGVSELIIIFVILSVFLIIGISAVVGFVFFGLKRNNRNREIWKNSAKNLNLQMPDSSKLEMNGIYNNSQVKLALGARRVSENTEFFTYCVTDFPQSLRFLLNISSPKYLLSGILSGEGFKTGNSEFDNNFIGKAYNENVFKQLLLGDFPSNQTKNLLEDLVLARQSIKIIKVTDAKVYTEITGTVIDENLMKQMLEITTYLAKRWQAIREKFPLSDWEKQLFYNWQDLANEKNLRFDAKKLEITGVYRGFPTTVFLETEKECWQTCFRIKFPRNLMMGLQILPENSLHQALTWLGVQDVKVGIPEFDDAFIVKAKNIGAVKNLLESRLCQHLSMLKNQSHDLKITDEEFSLTVNTVVGDKKNLADYLQNIIMAVELIQN